MTTALFSSDKFKQHETGPGFPEAPARLDAIIKYLHESKIIDDLKVIEPEIDGKENVLLIHDSEYINRVHEACDFGAPIVDTIDNPISKYSYDTALLAAGAMTQAVSQVLEGKVHNAMVLPRPPGHHAEKNQAMGFCLFNNVAIAARYAQQNYNIEKVVKKEQLFENWENIVGKDLSKKCRPLKTENNILFLKTKNSVWRNELKLRQKDLLKLIQKNIGNKIITHIRFL